mmetsp:Transcript_81407/g.141010  ORF Transcript_81407/g.141010 Transcript_81407/m.141010 type:complete len:164 (+) Transcript_81407:3-494(+)
MKMIHTQGSPSLGSRYNWTHELAEPGSKKASSASFTPDELHLITATMTPTGAPSFALLLWASRGSVRHFVGTSARRYFRSCLMPCAAARSTHAALCVLERCGHGGSTAGFWYGSYQRPTAWLLGSAQCERASSDRPHHSAASGQMPNPLVGLNEQQQPQLCQP